MPAKSSVSGSLVYGQGSDWGENGFWRAESAANGIRRTDSARTHFSYNTSTGTTDSTAIGVQKYAAMEKGLARRTDSAPAFVVGNRKIEGHGHGQFARADRTTSTPSIVFRDEHVPRGSQNQAVKKPLYTDIYADLKRSAHSSNSNSRSAPHSGNQSGTHESTLPCHPNTSSDAMLASRTASGIASSIQSGKSTLVDHGSHGKNVDHGVANSVTSRTSTVVREDTKSEDSVHTKKQCSMYKARSWWFDSRCVCGKKKLHAEHLQLHPCSACGEKFSPMRNKKPTCRKHSGTPIFISNEKDGLKLFVWSCCPNQHALAKSMTDFLKLPLAHGQHI